MSDLKFPFKFKCRNYEAPVYTANLNTRSGRVEFLWKYEDGSYGHTSFPLDDAKAYVSEGYWIIQQEGKSVDSDPNVTIKQSELDALIDEINMLRELLAEAYKPATPTFKPISEMTMEDWKQAKEEGWVFETEARGRVTVIDLCFKEEIVRLETSRRYWWVDSKGYDDDQAGFTVVKRIQ